jgi:hypothetical protein
MEMQQKMIIEETIKRKRGNKRRAMKKINFLPVVFCLKEINSTVEDSNQL